MKLLKLKTPQRILLALLGIGLPVMIMLLNPPPTAKPKSISTPFFLSHPDPSPRSNYLDDDMSAIAHETASRLIPILGSNNSGPGGSISISVLIASVRDPSLPLIIRRRAAWQLAKIGSDEAMAVLRDVFSDAPIQLKATIAEALGNAKHPSAKNFLYSLLSDENEAVSLAAVRGLAASGKRDAIDRLAAILVDSEWTDDIRIEAALALGEVPVPTAHAALLEAVFTSRDSDLTKAILTGLGRRSFDETQSFFRSYLASGNVDDELRIAALEGLGEADGDPTKFLASFLRDPNSEIRAAAAWAIANLATPSDIGGDLLARLQREPDSGVRTHIYQALENQQTVDIAILLRSVFIETDPSSRVAGFKLLATHSRLRTDQFLSAQFDRAIVPELQTLALSAEETHMRLASVLVLREAKTQQAINALRAVASQSLDPSVVKAARVILLSLP